MNPSTTLLDLLRAGSSGPAADFLDEHPESALGDGPNGESLILTAIYTGQTELATRLAGLRTPDLCEAAALGDAQRVATLLGRGDSADLRSWDGWTPLHLAAYTGRAEAARALVSRGAPVDAVSTNATKNTPLCAALAGSGDHEIVRLLLEAGADPNFRAELGVTPLHLAASRGADALVHQLLEHGAEKAARMDDGTTPAGIAAARGHAATAALLELGSAPHAHDA
jgi:ankyrin repeat protein